MADEGHRSTRRGFICGHTVLHLARDFEGVPADDYASADHGVAICGLAEGNVYSVGFAQAVWPDVDVCLICRRRSGEA